LAHFAKHSRTHGTLRRLVKVKVKFVLAVAAKVQRRSRGSDLLFL
jgi:hypothetical protein